MAIPEGKKAGDTFDVVCTFRVERNGSVCLTKMGDTDTDYDKGEQPEMESKPDYSEMTKSMQGELQQPDAASEAAPNEMTA